MIYSEKHNDLDFALKQQVGDWSIHAIALAQLRKEKPKEADDIFKLQKYNTEFWLAFKKEYQQAMRTFDDSEIKALEEKAKHWLKVLDEKITNTDWDVETL